MPYFGGVFIGIAITTDDPTVKALALVCAAVMVALDWRRLTGDHRPGG